MQENSSSKEIPKHESPTHWLSLEHLQRTEKFAKLAEEEFQSSPLRPENQSEEPWARREFMKLMGASLALGAAAGCARRPEEKIIPYAKQPEEVVHGVPNYYVSSWADGLDVQSLLIKSNEGRPTKVEGNAQFAPTGGGTSARSQAHIMQLYDPDRLTGPKRNLLNKKRSNRDTVSVKFDEADGEISAQLKKGGVAVLTGTLTSPSERALVKDFCSAFAAQHYIWEPNCYGSLREAQRLAYGMDVIPHFRFDRAQVVVSVEADFLGTWIAPTQFNRQFSNTRQPGQQMSRLTVFEAGYSLTGVNADQRVKIKPSQQSAVLWKIASDLVAKKGLGKGIDANLLDQIKKRAGSFTAPAHWDSLIDSLASHKAKSLVITGANGDNAVESQLAAAFINSILENYGVTVDLHSGLSYATGANQQLIQLIQEMEAKKIKTLIVHKTNPCFSAVSSGFSEALKSVELVISTSTHMDETAQQAHFVLPDVHPMEGWGDYEGFDGFVCVRQPTIRGLYDSRSFYLSLMTWGYMAKQGPKRLQELETAYDYVRAVWKEEIFPGASKAKNDFETDWEDLLQKGFIQRASTAGRENGKAAGSWENLIATALKNKKSDSKSELELFLHPTVMFSYGTMNNVAWLNELPDPVTKIVWDNVAALSIATAHRMGCKEGDVLSISGKGKESIELPVHIQPGLHDEVVAIALGYGRTAVGQVGNGIGKNAYALVEFSADSGLQSGSAVTVKKTGQKIQIATTQHAHAMEGRKIINEVSLADYQKDPAFGNKRPHTYSIWGGHQYNGHKWGMAVDMNTCTGCSACMVACQSENNVPVVGKKYVLQGREMHWIRIDRYYVGDPADAHAVVQPVMCQHCDNAPCETVCPVAATVHSDEGLNDMVYNRCVGTRYCSNNCPYKVRRFNWFNYAKNIVAPSHLALNPDVTTRIRGVMEKCTFCTHRIKEVKVKARVEGRTLKDGDIRVACESACPTGAIVFGDLNDPHSRVAKAFKDEPRAYGLIEEFNAAPAVRYLTKVRNGEVFRHDSVNKDYVGNSTPAAMTQGSES